MTPLGAIDENSTEDAFGHLRPNDDGPYCMRVEDLPECYNLPWFVAEGRQFQDADGVAKRYRDVWHWIPGALLCRAWFEMFASAFVFATRNGATVPAPPKSTDVSVTSKGLLMLLQHPSAELRQWVLLYLAPIAKPSRERTRRHPDT